MILTPLQQIKDNYYKMSESQFHYWMSQNIETLMKQERDIIVNTYNREPIDGIQNWFIRDGERYYELHMEGKSGIREYSSGNKAYTVDEQPLKIKVDPDKVISIPPKLISENGRGNKRTTDENYSFEDGV
jgi:hypothetical protein